MSLERDTATWQRFVDEMAWLQFDTDEDNPGGAEHITAQAENVLERTEYLQARAEQERQLVVRRSIDHIGPA